MKVEKKAKRFITIVKSQIDSEPKLKKRKHLKRAVVGAVQELPTGKLKDELLNNLEKYLDELNISSRKNKTQTTAQDGAPKEGSATAQLPYNFYHATGRKISKQALRECSAEKKSAVSKCFLQKKILKLKKEGAIEKLLSNCKASTEAEREDPLSWIPDIHLLCSFLCGRDDAELFQRIMVYFHSKLMECAEDGLASLKKKQIKTLMKEMLQFLFFCHHKYQDLDQSFPVQKPRYTDLVAAILSVYVDVALVHSRSGGKDADDMQCCRLGKQLVANVLHFLQHSPESTLDVLLQVSMATQADDDIMVPLCRKGLAAPDRLSNIVYSKYVIAVRQMAALYRSQLEDVSQTALGVSAPSKYLHWLREQDPGVMDQIPEHNGFRKTRVTQFLLEEAGEELMSRILDLLTDGPEELDPTSEASQAQIPSADETGGDRQGQTEGRSVTETETSLGFFMDKTSDRKMMKILQVEFNHDQETEAGEDGEDDHSDIVIDDDVLDLDLAKMDQSSEEEEEASSEDETELISSAEFGVIDRTAASLDDVLANQNVQKLSSNQSPALVLSLDESSGDDRSMSPELFISKNSPLKTPEKAVTSTSITVATPRSYFKSTNEQGTDYKMLSEAPIISLMDSDDEPELNTSIKARELTTGSKTLSDDEKHMELSDSQKHATVSDLPKSSSKSIDSNEPDCESVKEPNSPSPQDIDEAETRKKACTGSSPRTKMIAAQSDSYLESAAKKSEKLLKSPQRTSSDPVELTPRKSLTREEKQTPRRSRRVSASVNDEEIIGDTDQVVDTIGTPRKRAINIADSPTKVALTPSRRSRRISLQESTPSTPVRRSRRISMQDSETETQVTPKPDISASTNTLLAKKQKMSARTPKLCQIKGSPSEQQASPISAKKKTRKFPSDVYDFQSDSDTSIRPSSRNLTTLESVKPVSVDLGEQADPKKPDDVTVKTRRRTIAASSESKATILVAQKMLTSLRRKSMPLKPDVMVEDAQAGPSRSTRRNARQENSETPVKRRKEVAADGDSFVAASPRKTSETPVKRRKELAADADSFVAASPRKTPSGKRRSLASKSSPKYSLRSSQK